MLLQCVLPVSRSAICHSRLIHCFRCGMSPLPIVSHSLARHSCAFASVHSQFLSGAQLECGTADPWKPDCPVIPMPPPDKPRAVWVAEVPLKRALPPTQSDGRVPRERRGGGGEQECSVNTSMHTTYLFVFSVGMLCMSWFSRNMAQARASARCGTTPAGLQKLCHYPHKRHHQINKPEHSGASFRSKMDKLAKCFSGTSLAAKIGD